MFQLTNPFVFRCLMLKALSVNMPELVLSPPAASGSGNTRTIWNKEK